MNEVRGLPIFTEDWRALDLQAIKDAKLALTDIDFKVKPVPATIHTTDRILAVGQKPHGDHGFWICDYALVSERTSPEGWQAALHWVLTEEDHPKATTVLDIMVSAFGPGTREISTEELEGEAAYRAYLGQE